MLLALYQCADLLGQLLGFSLCAKGFASVSGAARNLRPLCCPAKGTPSLWRCFPSWVFALWDSTQDRSPPEARKRGAMTDVLPTRSPPGH